MVKLLLLVLACTFSRLLQLTFVAAPPPPSRHTGTGTGKLTEAPRWLHAHQSPLGAALYFPLKHRSHLQEGFPSFQNRHHHGRSTVEVTWALIKETNPMSYYTTLSLGTPGQLFNVLVDTGSALLWLQCDCIHCDTSSTLPLRPYSTDNSSSGRSVACTDALCTQFKSSYREVFGCNLSSPNATLGNYTSSGDTCDYIVRYLDGSYSFGNVRVDTLALSLSNGTSLAPSVPFGCGRIQSDGFFRGDYNYDGLMGLAMGIDSILSYLRDIGKSFSVCLEGEGTDGHLVLGRTTLPNGASFSPVYVGQNVMFFWQLDWRGFSVGSGDVVQIAGPLPTVWDTGSTFSLLPAEIFGQIYSQILSLPVDEIRKSVGYPVKQYKGGHLTSLDIARLFPSVKLYFPNEAGSGNVVMEIPAFNALYLEYGTVNGVEYTFVYMAAFIADITLIGGSWLRNFEILHEQTSETSARIGWFPVNCTSGRELYPNGTTGSIVVNYSASTSGTNLPSTQTSSFPPPQNTVLINSSRNPTSPGSSAVRNTNFVSWKYVQLPLFLVPVLVHFLSR